MSGFRIYIDQIPQDGLHCEGEIPPEDLDLDDGEFVESDFPLKYSVDASVVSDELLVFGSISVDLRMRCSRCAVMFPVTVAVNDYSFNLHVDKTLEYADLTEDMREATILAFSSYPVCSEDCRGLCPQCGANLNEGECKCRPPGDIRWDGLDSVLTKNEI